MYNGLVVKNKFLYGSPEAIKKGKVLFNETFFAYLSPYLLTKRAQGKGIPFF